MNEKFEYFPAHLRAYRDHGWLKSSFSFSFADYYDPKRMGFGALRVINDDHIAPKMGFATHPHQNMEIVTFVTAGAIKHQDSEGNEGIIRPGEIQIMSAGTGIRHSEFNPSSSEACELLQIWVLPKSLNTKPTYQQRAFEFKPNILNLILSPDGREKSLLINQNAFFSYGEFTDSGIEKYTVKNSQNWLYIFLITGELKISDQVLSKRDALGGTQLSSFEFQLNQPSKILFMEVPAI